MLFCCLLPFFFAAFSAAFTYHFYGRAFVRLLPLPVLASLSTAFLSALLMLAMSHFLVEICWPFLYGARGKKARRHGTHNQRPSIHQHEQHDLERQ